MKKQDVINCSFTSWYPQFKQLSIESIVLKVPLQFIDYLHADGLYLPEENKETSCQPSRSSDSDEELWSDADTVICTNNSCHSECLCGPEQKSQLIFQSQEFRDFQQDINKAINELGGNIMPKLNWSSPKDATWISFNNSLRCQNASDIFLLLKSSEFVAHDLDSPFASCLDHDDTESVEYTLVLRKWTEIHPSSEFRCFVKAGILIAVCQRQQQFYSHILEDKENTIQAIESFFEKFIKGKFPNEDFVFDIYQPKPGDIKLLDFNPFDSVTDGLLFSWAELNGEELFSEQLEENDASNENIIFRCLESNDASSGSGLKQFSYPVDFQHLSSGEDPSKLIDLLKLHHRVQHRLSSSSSENDSNPS